MGLFKSKKIYYKYNPETLSFERVYLTLKQRIFAFVKHASVGILVGVALFFLFANIFSSPMESLLKKENKLLQTQYEVLRLQLNNALDVLDDIQQRDENLYRAIFQARSIPESVRKPGFGGTNRYAYLSSLSNADLVIETTQKLDMLKKQLYVESKSLEELITIGKSLEERVRCIPAIQPISNKDLKHMASGYGTRIDPIYHTLRFHATGNGRIILAGWKQGYGNCVIIDHGYGYKTLYGHMEKILVREGQKVNRGEVIGLVGSTGKSTGPHLHYEVHINDKPDNPAKYYYQDLNPEEYDQMLQMSENHGQVMD